MELSNDAFWSHYHQRDLLLVLAKRWGKLPGRLRKQIEDRLLEGPAQWEGEEDLAGFSDHETTRFQAELNQKITRGRSSLLLRNHLERLYIISSGIDHWIHINQDILFRDTDSVKAITVKIQKNQERMVQLKSLECCKNTLALRR